MLLSSREREMLALVARGLTDLPQLTSRGLLGAVSLPSQMAHLR